MLSVITVKFEILTATMVHGQCASSWQTSWRLVKLLLRYELLFMKVCTPVFVHKFYVHIQQQTAALV